MDLYYTAINEFIIKVTNGTFDLRHMVYERDDVIAMFYHGNSARQAALRIMAANGIKVVAA